MDALNGVVTASTEDKEEARVSTNRVSMRASLSTIAFLSPWLGLWLESFLSFSCMGFVDGGGLQRCSMG